MPCSFDWSFRRQFVNRRLDVRLIKRAGEGDNLSLARIERQTSRGGNEQQVCNELSRVEIFDRINFESRFLFRGIMCLHLLDHPFDRSLFDGGGESIDLLGLKVRDDLGRREHFDKHFFSDFRIRRFDGIDSDFGRRNGDRRRRSRGNGHGGDDGIDGPHNPGGIGDQQLFCLCEQDTFSERAQQRGDFRLNRLRIVITEREQDADKLEFSPFVEIFEGNPGYQSLGNPFLNVDHQ